MKGLLSMPSERVLRVGRAGVRAPIAAWKSGNADGAKGCRKVDVRCLRPMKESPRQCRITAMQAGETQPREWKWVERSVWTERMLEGLEKGVKGGVWFSLIDKVLRPTTLHAAWLTVKANRGSAGSDHQSLEAFESKLTHHRGLRQHPMAKSILPGPWVLQPGSSPSCFDPVLIRQHHRPESRMREIRMSGSEGGAVQINAPFLPLWLFQDLEDPCPRGNDV